MPTSVIGRSITTFFIGFVLCAFGGSLTRAQGKSVGSSRPFDISTLSGSTGCAPQPRSITNWYKGENNLVESTGSGHSAIFVGSGLSPYAPGMVGQAFDFNGSDYIATADSIYRVGSYEVSLSAWVNPATSVQQAIASTWNGSPGMGNGLSLDTDGTGTRLRFMVFYTTNASPGKVFIVQTTDPVLTQGHFTNVTATFSTVSGTMHLYVDGVDAHLDILASDPITAVDVSGVAMHIGALKPLSGPDTELWHGQIDEFQIYSRVLSPAEALSIYNAGSAGVCTGTVGWGQDAFAELGVGNTTNTRPDPVTLSAVPDVTAVAPGRIHTLFLKANGTIVASGTDSSGELGDGTTSGYLRMSPVPVQNLTGVTQVAAADGHSAALRNDGTVWVWGRDSYGEIGNGTTLTTDCYCYWLPTQANISSVVQIAAGGYHSMALKSDGTVWTWGDDSDGVLGRGTAYQPSASPVQVGVGVAGFNNIIAISTGYTHAIALKNDGTVWAWGRNSEGEVGTGTQIDQTLPLKIPTLQNIVQISAGNYHSIALDNMGNVYVWGHGIYGEAGNGSAAANQFTPVRNSTLTGISEVRAGGYHNLAMGHDGSIWSWGENYVGQIGNGTGNGDAGCCQLTPFAVPVVNKISIAAGFDDSFALDPVISLNSGTNQTFVGDRLRVTFSSLASLGNLNYKPIDPASVGAAFTMPSGYVVQPLQRGVDVASTAPFSGNVDVCFENVNEFSPTNFSFLKILHAEGSAWVDRTISFDPQRREICARVNSLSPFIIAKALQPTAATVRVAGRIITPDGSGIRGATVTLTDSSGNRHNAVANAFGYYAFDSIASGQSLVLTATARAHVFAPRVINVTDDLDAPDLIAIQ